MKQILLLLLPLFTCTFRGAARQGKDSLEGTWKGTSLCQVKTSPCHDENAVYHITKGLETNTYHIQMNKMVNGIEEEMGPLDCVFDAQKKTLRGITKDRQAREGVWLFRVDGTTLHGSLTIDGNTLYRLIEVKKQ